MGWKAWRQERMTECLEKQVQSGTETGESRPRGVWHTQKTEPAEPGASEVSRTRHRAEVATAGQPRLTLRATRNEQKATATLASPRPAPLQVLSRMLLAQLRKEGTIRQGEPTRANGKSRIREELTRDAKRHVCEARAKTEWTLPQGSREDVPSPKKG